MTGNPLVEIAVVLWVAAVTPVALSAQAATRACIPEPEMTLVGLRLGDARDAALQRLGPPLGVSTGRGVDDGGAYDAETLTYPGLTVIVVRGVVDVVSSRSPDIGTPSGLRPGLNLAELERILGFPHDADRSGGPRISFGQCLGDMEGDEWGITFVTEDRTILAVELWTNRP